MSILQFPDGFRPTGLFVPRPNRLLRISYRRLSATLDRELSDVTPRFIPNMRVS